MNIAFIIDPVESLHVRKDSSIAMMLAAQKRGWEVFILYQADLYSLDTEVRATCRHITLEPDKIEAGQPDWFGYLEEHDLALRDMDVIMMRKDPPFDMEYINTTYLLDLAGEQGCLIVNPPAALRHFNEKMFITRFPQCCTPFLISRNMKKLRAFIDQRHRQAQQDVILKPLDGMGGASIFRVNPDDANLSVILENVTGHGAKTVMAQQFIPDIRLGDKRILLVDGEAIPYALARIPAQGETRGNLAAGGEGVGQPLSERDVWICRQIAPYLKQHGILFAGIDVIGDYLTEINITSPTCIRELDQQFRLDIAGTLIEAIASRLPSA